MNDSATLAMLSVDAITDAVFNSVLGDCQVSDIVKVDAGFCSIGGIVLYSIIVDRGRCH
ncbi:hypothetical protein ES703_64953 [subsurface metagenome]